jgi:rubredoxin
VIVFEGSVLHDGAEHAGLAVVSIQPDEPAFEVRAGARGLKGLVVNFPRVGAADAAGASPERGAGLKRWQCALCAFSYDEALGMPEDGIAAGTRWADVPESWTCPDCGACKTDFEMIEA